jgi:AraC-like DNA-binding protein
MRVFKPSKLRAYLLRAREHGIPPETILEGGGVSWDEIENLAPLDLDRMSVLFDLLATRTPPGFSIQCGRTCKVGEYGIVGFSMMSMPTLRAAMDQWNRYCLVAGHPIITSTRENGSEWEMHFQLRRSMSPAAERFCIEAAMVGLEATIRELTGEPANARRIDLPYGPPDDMAPFGIFTTSQIRFNRGGAIYYGERSDLDRLIPAHDDQIRSILEGQCAGLLAALNQDQDILERIEDVIHVSSGHLPSLDEIATQLGLSRRSLQRELSNRGINFRDYIRQFRHRQAESLLLEGRFNIKTIAYMLGFKDAGSFRRAFHDWTGRSISEWLAARSQSERRMDAHGTQMLQLA